MTNVVAWGLPDGLVPPRRLMRGPWWGRRDMRPAYGKGIRQWQQGRWWCFRRVAVLVRGLAVMTLW